MSELQFDKAETGESACAACRQPITDQYFEANGQHVCPRCREALTRGPQGTQFQALASSFLRGGIAALLCAGLNAAIVHFSGWSLALVWIFCGLWIGSAVQKASDGRGGWPFKLLAVFLTYFAMGLSLVFLLLAETELSQSLGAIGMAVASVIALVAGPVIECFSSPISIIIYGIGLYNAAVAVQKVNIEVTGPYRLKPVEPVEPEPAAPLP